MNQSLGILIKVAPIQTEMNYDVLCNLYHILFNQVASILLYTEVEKYVSLKLNSPLKLGRIVKSVSFSFVLLKEISSEIQLILTFIIGSFPSWLVLTKHHNWLRPFLMPQCYSQSVDVSILQLYCYILDMFLPP